MSLTVTLVITVIVNIAYCSVDLSGIKAANNRLVNYKNETVNIKGLNHAGTEYQCVRGKGIFDGPSNKSLVTSFKAWNANAVRVPLNEDCWFAINGIKPEYSGTHYQGNISGFVKMFTDEGFVVILDLHWSAPGSQKASGQQPMPDMDHSVNFWISVAQKFQNNSKVIFELYTEPYPDSDNWNSTDAWKCWRDGGSCHGVPFKAVGMQTLVNVVRSVGAKNLILLGGIAYSNSLAQWVEYAPKDPVNNIGAAWHSYNNYQCKNQTCWDQYVKPVASKYPVVATEIGENDCAGAYVTPLMAWLDANAGGHYLPWTFNNLDCKTGPALISNYDGNGTPTIYGEAVKNFYNHTNHSLSFWIK